MIIEFFCNVIACVCIAFIILATTNPDAAGLFLQAVWAWL